MRRRLPERDREENLVVQVRESVERFQLFHHGDRIVVGVSGGPDSVCLLFVLRELIPQWEIDIVVAHLHHGVREAEADGDQKFVESLSRDLGVPFFTDRVDVPNHAKRFKMSKQVAARELRFTFFNSVANETGAQRVALGHTADDQAETVLMRMFRGTGSRGLQGIPPIREDLYIRPLLFVTRKKIETFLKKRDIPFREDSSNRERFYLRNRIRLDVLPDLERNINPRLRETLCRQAFLLSQDGELLDKEAIRIFQTTRVVQDGSVALNLDVLRFLPIALRWRVLRLAMETVAGTLQGYSMDHVMSVDSLLENGKSRKGEFLPRYLQVVKEKSFLVFASKKIRPTLPSPWEFSLSIPGKLEPEGMSFRISAQLASESPPRNLKDTAVFDWDRLPRPLLVRNWREGDYFYPAGLGGKKKLQDYFVDQKIPRSFRQEIPLLASSQGILWVMGFRLDGRYLADSKTRTNLVVSLQQKG